jgi:alpha-beta hydrolase superfamily lysophospholipase
MSAVLRARGRWKELFGKGKHIMPDARIEDASFFVPMHVVPGKDDSVVPVRETEGFVEKARRRYEGCVCYARRGSWF